MRCVSMCCVPVQAKMTALMVAAYKGHVPCVSTLLAAGADVALQDEVRAPDNLLAARMLLLLPAADDLHAARHMGTCTAFVLGCLRRTGTQHCTWQLQVATLPAWSCCWAVPISEWMQQVLCVCCS